MEVSTEIKVQSTFVKQEETTKQEISFTDQQISDFVRDLISDCKEEATAYFIQTRYNSSKIKDNIEQAQSRSVEVINFLNSKASELEEASTITEDSVETEDKTAESEKKDSDSDIFARLNLEKNIEKKITKSDAYRTIAADVEKLCNERTKCYNEVACKTFAQAMTIVAIPLCGMIAGALTDRAYLAERNFVLTSLAVGTIAIVNKMFSISDRRGAVIDCASTLETVAKQHLPKATIKLAAPQTLAW